MNDEFKDETNGNTYKTFLVTALICFLILLMRDPMGAWAPPINVEDASQMLSFYWRDHNPLRILRFYGGYISLGPNIIGYISGQLSGQAPVFLLHWAPILISACTFASMLLPGVSFFGLSTNQKIIVSLVWVLVPAGNWALVSNTTYTQWPMLIFLLTMSVFWTPRSIAGGTILFFFLAIASWSHPLAILLLPVVLVRIVISNSMFERSGFVVLSVSMMFYSMLGIDYAGPSDQAGSLLGFQFLKDCMLTLSRAVAEPLVSIGIRVWLLERGLPQVIIAVAILAVMLTALLLLRIRKDLSRKEIVQLVGISVYGIIFVAA